MNAQTQREHRLAETRRVTLVGAVANLLLSVVKIVVGVVGQSASLIADGIHSLSDLASDGVVWVAAHHAAEGPDEEHPYGHGRFETAATLLLGILMGLVALGIGWDATHRLFSPDQLMQPGGAALAAAFASVLIKEWLYHYTLRAGRRIKSEMLRANAWHHRSDAISSVVVLIGVGGTIAGLPYLDAIAAIVVSVMIAQIGWDLGWPAFHDLMDAGLEQERLDKIRETILSIGGVCALHMLRTRKMGGEQASVDVHVLVEPWLSVSEGHMIGQTVIDRLREEIEEVSDVTVHIDPEDDEEAPPSTGLPLRTEAERLLAERWREIPEFRECRRILLHYLDGRVHVDLCLPLASFRESGDTAALCQRLQEAVADSGTFGSVRLFYGDDAQ